MRADNNKDYMEFNNKTSLLLDVVVLSFLLIMFSIFGLGVPFGVVFAATIATLKNRLDGGKDRTFNKFMEYSTKFLGKATLIWLMLYPVLIIIGVNLYIATKMGEIGLYIVIFDIIVLILFFTYCFYIFYEFMKDSKQKKIELFKKAFHKMKNNSSNTFFHIGIMVGIAGALIFIPYYVIKVGVVYLLLCLLLVISCISMRDVK